MSLTQPCKSGQRARSTSLSSDILPEKTSAYNTLQQTLMQDIKSILPELIKSAVQTAVATALKEKDELQKEITGLRKTNSDLMNKVNGYKTQVNKWITETKFLQETTMPDLVQQVNALESNWKSKEKSLASKAKELINTQNRLTNEVLQTSNLNLNGRSC